MGIQTFYFNGKKQIDILTILASCFTNYIQKNNFSYRTILPITFYHKKIITNNFLRLKTCFDKDQIAVIVSPKTLKV